MRNTKKLLVLIAVVAVMIAALVVSTSAYVAWDETNGTFTGGSNSAYADINNSDWVQVGAGKAVADGNGTYTGEGALGKINNGEAKAYFNETTGVLVIEGNGSTALTGGSGDSGNAAQFAAWCKANAEKVTTLELRGIRSLNNAAYVYDRLTSVKTIKIDTICDRFNGSKNDTAPFKGLNAFDTLLWGTWDKEATENSFTKKIGEDGVIDLTGFKELIAATTTYNGTHYVMYNGSMVAGTSAKKILLPGSLKNASWQNWNEIAVADGTDAYIEQSSSSSNYGKTIAKNAACTKLIKIGTGVDGIPAEYGYTTNWTWDKTVWSSISYKAVDTAPFYGEYAGVIGLSFAENATKLEEIVIGAGAKLQLIETKAFNGCKALKVIDIKGTVADDLVIEANAFGGVTGLTIKVYDDISEVNMNKALMTAGIEGVTVVNNSPTKGAIKADGYSMRLEEREPGQGPALRCLFSFDETVINNAQSAGYTFDGAGIILISEKTFNSYNGDISAIMGAIGTDRKIVTKEIDYEWGPWTDYENRQFCVAVVGIKDVNFTDAIYSVAYSQWTKDNVTSYSFTTYTSENTGKSAHSLYDATIYAYKNGIANAANTDESCLWGVLDNGVVTLSEFTAREGATIAYETNDDGSFTYLDIPVRKYTFGGPNSWTTYSATVEAVPTTGLTWTLLADGDNYVVAYRKTDAAAPEGVTYDYTLPKMWEGKGALPFDASYYSTVNNQDTKYTDKNGVVTMYPAMPNKNLYSPVLPLAVTEKITTLVLDAGVAKIGNRSLDTDSSSKLETVVYPDGIKIDSGFLMNAGKVKNFTRATADKSYLADYDCDSLIDLTGVSGSFGNGSFEYASSIENILLPEGAKFAQQTVFAYAKALKRVWTVGDAMPEAGTLDFSKANIDLICKAFFRDVTGTVIMPESFKGINNYSMATLNQKSDTNRWYIFGDNSTTTKITIEVQNWDALNCIANTFVDTHQNADYNDGSEKAKIIINNLKITYNGVTKTVLEWRSAFPANPNATPEA